MNYRLDHHQKKSLAGYFGQCATKRYEWGVFDCATFAADWVKMLTGVDLMEDARGGYSDHRSAMYRLSLRGGFLGWTHRLPEILYLIDGAIVIVEKPGESDTLAIWNQGKAWHPMPKGLGEYNGKVNRIFFPMINQSPCISQS